MANEPQTEEQAIDNLKAALAQNYANVAKRAEWEAACNATVRPALEYVAGMLRVYGWGEKVTPGTVNNAPSAELSIEVATTTQPQRRGILLAYSSTTEAMTVEYTKPDGYNDSITDVPIGEADRGKVIDLVANFINAVLNAEP